MRPSAKPKYDQKYLKKGSKVIGLGQWVKKIKNCCMMFFLAANQSCGISEAPKIVLKSLVSYLWKRTLLGAERSNGLRKIHVKDVEGPYGQPPQNCLKSMFSVDFFMHFQINMLSEANHRRYGQASHCEDGCHEKMPKNEKQNFS